MSFKHMHFKNKMNKDVSYPNCHTTKNLTSVATIVQNLEENQFGFQ